MEHKMQCDESTKESRKEGQSSQEITLSCGTFLVGKTYLEPEDCHRCEKKTNHVVVYKYMSNGKPMRQGTCSKCFIKRALPIQSGKKPEDYVIYFGKYAGQPLRNIPTDYLKWVVGNVDSLSNVAKERIAMVILRRGVS